jgi:hypothetical protein
VRALLLLLSSIGEDSGQRYDNVARTTLAWVGMVILAVLGVLTLLVHTNVRRRMQP